MNLESLKTKADLATGNLRKAILRAIQSNEPLEDRWEIYLEYNQYLDCEPYMVHWDWTRKRADEIEEIRDLYQDFLYSCNEKHETIDLCELVEFLVEALESQEPLMDCFGELIETKSGKELELSEEMVDEFKEEIMQKGIRGFIHDW